MGPNQTYKLLHSKGNHKQNEKTTHRMGENICKWCDRQGLNFQNIQTAHTTQCQKTPVTTLAVQWLRLCTPTAGGTSSIPGQGTKIPYATQHGQILKNCSKKQTTRASLLAQWLTICLPMQGTWVRVPVLEDPTCCGATKPMHHNYWAQAPRACALQQEKPPQWEARAPQRRVAPAHRN